LTTAEQVTRQFQRPIRILDLGCGDSTLHTAFAQAVPIKRYVALMNPMVHSSLQQKTCRPPMLFELLNGNP
jgi:hypothetical protein